MLIKRLLEVVHGHAWTHRFSWSSRPDDQSLGTFSYKSWWGFSVGRRGAAAALAVAAN